ncbi:S9 family peptidase [Luteococcus sediminum]
MPTSTADSTHHTEPQPPVAARHRVVRSFHGDELVDDFEWLREKDSAEVIAHLEAENRYTEQVTAHLEDLRQEIYDDISARTKQTDLGVPAHVTHTVDGASHGWWYYMRTVEGCDYPLHCRVPDVDGTRPDLSGEVPGEQVLLDGNVEAEGRDFFSVGGFSVSPDGTMLAWSVDHRGDERYQLYVRDLSTGRDFGPTHEDLAHGVCWAGNRHLVYSRVDDAWRPFQVWCHELQTDPEQDRLLLQEDDERFWLGVDESRSRGHLVFGASSKLTSEYWLLAVGELDQAPRSVAGRAEGVDYQVEVAGDRLLVLHNRDFVDYELATAPLQSSTAEDWRPVLPGTPGVRLESVDAHAAHAVVSARRDGLSAVAVLHREGEDWSGPHWVDFDEPVHEVVAHSEPDWNATTVRLRYTSLVTPPSVLELDLANGNLAELKRTQVLPHPVHGPHDPADYVTERLWATAEDGTRIPISLVRRADVVADGTAPCLLYGYGSYEVSTPPAFSISRLSLLQRGIVYAIAHVRGGGEMGRRWYDEGSQLAKPNTFTDFVACAQHLVDQGWTSPDRLAARGGSAGGLLVGAVTNLAPELFRAVHAAVPFVDPLTSITMPELPLTVVEWEEWGNPIDDAKVYACMKGYSPYENIASGPYPAILATTSLNDTRVLYVEPAKWVARLRERVQARPGHEILLLTQMSAGHGGVSGRYGSWREEAFELAWIIDQISGPTR